MEKEKHDFWQHHSRRYLEMAFRTDRQEMIRNPDGYGKSTGDCGDTVEMFLTIENDAIRSVSFNVHGCMNTNACANVAAELVEGKGLDEAWKITPEQVIRYLETLPPEGEHCAELAVGALYLALRNFQESRRSPWKKWYGGA